MPQLVIVADDLTDAADAAALFAVHGLATAIPLGDCPPPWADVIACSSESRDSTPIQAAAATRAVLARVLNRGGEQPRFIYKKLDSALRGHPGRELIAMMELCERRLAVVAPALPSEGRTTVGGHQCLNGLPLETSPFGREGIASDVLAAFSGFAGIRVLHVALAGLRAGELTGALAQPGSDRTIVVVDAELEDDLDRIARDAMAAKVTLLAGSAGLARALARTVELRSCARAPSWRSAHGRPLLIVAGTRHAAALAQIARAAGTGAIIVRPGQIDLDAEDGEMTEVCARVGCELARGRNVIVTTAGLDPSPRGAGAVAERLARVAVAPVVRELVGGMILTGGDVAAAVCAKLGATAFWLRGELSPAIPWGTLAGGALPGLPIVTKAGSFGGPDVFVDGLMHLANQHP